MTKKDATVLGGVLACATLFVIGKFRNEFVFDDVFVVEGDLIHDPARIGEVFGAHTLIAHGESSTKAMDTYRPLTLLTFFWDAWLSGRDPWSYHLTNHLLHLSVVVCLFMLARWLLPAASVWTLAAVALFFGLSPQLAEGHVWINGRSDPLAALFGLLALLTWRPGGGKRHVMIRQLGTGMLYFAGLLSKETLLLAMPSLLLWPTPEPRPLVSRMRALLPFGVAGLVYLGLRSWALQGMHATAGGAQLTTALKNLPVLWADGLRELIAPSRLYLRSMRDEYGMLSSREHLLIALAILVGVGLAVGVRKRLPVLSWGLAWFCWTLAPASMISFFLWPGFGRYLYIPCIGLAVGLGELLGQARAGLTRHFAEDPLKRRWLCRIAAGSVAIYLLALGTRLTTVTGNYASDKSLYLTAALAAPKPAYAYASYGTSRAHSGDFAGSIAPLEKAVQLDPGEPIYLFELAHSYLGSGNSTQAEALLRAGITRSPAALAGDLRALLVQALAGRDPSAAMAELCLCLHYQPEHPECLRAPHWLLDPRGARAAEFRDQFANLRASCQSARARDALAEALGSL